MLLIGNKPYDKLNLNNIIDNFNKNIRHNFGLPNNNNGTKTYIQFLNGHVHDHIKRNNIDINMYNKNCGSDKKYLSNFLINYKKYNYRKIIKQDNGLTSKYNNFLKNNKCKHLFKKTPRLGCNSIFYCILNNIKPLFLSNYSLTLNENKNHLYNNKKTSSSCHNVNDEIKIIIWLHNNNILDATFSSLLDFELPILNCNIIIPKLESINIILKYYDYCILFYNKDDNKIIKLFENYKIINYFDAKIYIISNKNIKPIEKILLDHIKIFLNDIE